MYINNKYHLTYCTNIHSEKSWTDLFEKLKVNILEVKENISPEGLFGVGLRLSDYTSKELLEDDLLMKFKKWLDDNHLYVFTMNGFPYGVFHGKAVKDDVHKPDWTTKERVEYTKRLCRILAVLLPKGIEGGISTSPISYKPWHSDKKKMEEVYRKGALHLSLIVEDMLHIRRETGKVLHLDIEPEPDGLLENTTEVISFFKNYLIPQGTDHLVNKLALSPAVAEEAIKTHIRVCYDICHFAVGYENHREAIERFESEGIRIGKIQISSALKAEFANDEEKTKMLLDEFEKLNDPTYLHQVIAKDISDELIQYRDLPEAMKNIDNVKCKEWRMHFHVPLFVDSYGSLNSTQEDVIEVLNIFKEKKFSDHLEVETYTWEVLPEDLKIDLKDSITRELSWVLNIVEISAMHTNE